MGGLGSPLSRIETKGGRGLGGGSPEIWCPPGVCFGVYQREWVLTEDLELPEVET